MASTILLVPVLLMSTAMCASSVSSAALPRATHNGPIKHTDLVMIDKEVDFSAILINIFLAL